MKVSGKFPVIVGWCLVLNLAVQANSRFVRCKADLLYDVPNCPAIDDPKLKYIAIPHDCRAFLECTNGQAKCLRCPTGTVWDQTFGFCNDEGTYPCETADKPTSGPPGTL